MKAGPPTTRYEVHGMGVLRARRGYALKCMENTIVTSNADNFPRYKVATGSFPCCWSAICHYIAALEQSIATQNRPRLVDCKQLCHEHPGS